MKIIAKVKFNAGIALVLDKSPALKYKKVGSHLYGTDGIFYKCYEYRTPSRGFKAFAGRKFSITLENEEVVECNGQWWDGGYREVGAIVSAEIVCVTVGAIEDLKRCYVFTGYQADKTKIKELVSSADLPVIPYWDYEKIITFDDMRSKLYDKVFKLERDKKALIKNVKAKTKLLEVAGVI